MIKFLIGGSPCFSGDTLIYTSEGYKQIKDIAVGDYVLTHKNRFRRVTATGNRVSNVVELRAQGILPTTVTLNHPYYTLTKGHCRKKSTGGVVRCFNNPPQWKSVESLTTDDFLGINILQIEENPLNLSKELCWILGRYVADGHYRKTKRKHRKNSYQYQVIFSIGKDKLDYFKEKVKSYHFSCYPHTKSTYRCVISQQWLVDFIEKYNFGKSADTKRIPHIIMNLPKELLGEFLDGYFAGDGFETEVEYTCSTVSRELALGLCMAISKVKGMNATVYMPKLRTPAVIGGRLVNTKQQYVVGCKKRLCEHTQVYITDDIIWQPFKSITLLDEPITVYNISVEEDESYTANNAIVHNCTKWSIAQTKDREVVSSGEGWELFKNYLIAKEKFKPDFFLYENVKSMSSAIKAEITKELGVEPYLINSALVSAQNRERYYWTNIENVPMPEDRGILLKDILETGEALRKEKSYCLDSNYHKGGSLTDINNQSGRRLQVAEPVPFGENVSGKAYCLDASYYKGQPLEKVLIKKRRTMAAEPVCVAQRGRYTDSGNRYTKTEAPIEQFYEARTDGKTNTLTTVQKDNAVCEPVCLRYERNEIAKKLRKQYEAGEIKHGFNEHRELQPRPDGKTNTISTVTKDNPICEPVRIGCYPSPDGTIKNAQGMRLYSIDGKSVNLTAFGGGMGAKTGLYAIPVEFAGDVPVKAVSCADGKTYPVYEVRNGLITIKGKTYPIKLADGYYIIRKLTVTECCRLQTLPDDYCRAVSASQAYKGLGNGWTAEVIIHILKHANVPLGEEIVVLSMYDGIGTGRYCFDKMGYKNVKYYAYEIDKYAITVAMSNYPDIIQCGDAFQVREEDWAL